MWSDNETTEDLLGFEVHANLIHQLVTDKTLLPLTVGVFGDWGSGKSSVMRMLENKLQEDSEVAVIYFNGWQFEGYDDAKSALVHSIILGLAQHKKLSVEIRSRFAKLFSNIDWLRVGSTAYQIAMPFILSEYGSPPIVPPSQPVSSTHSQEQIEELITDIESIDIAKLAGLKPADKALMGARLLRRNFSALIEETHLKSVVILVDDLDRCDPKRLVETLEAIKLFLTVPKVAFVIGADERIVRYSISKRYDLDAVSENNHDRRDLTNLVTDYVEKLIQIPYYLPRLSQSEIETYMSLLFSQRNLEDDFKIVHKAYRDSRATDITATFGQRDIQKALTDANLTFPTLLDTDLSWCGTVAPALSDTLKGNPRQTKRLLNALILRQKLAKAARLENLDSGMLVKILLLEQLRNKLFGQLYAWQASSKGLPTQITELEVWAQSGEPNMPEALQKIVGDLTWAEPAMRIWLNMTPLLNNIDLRPYFWVTRDKVTNLSAGVGAIPRHIRFYLTEINEYKARGILTKTLSQDIKDLPTDEQILFIDELSTLLQRTKENRHLVEGWRKLAIDTNSQFIAQSLIDTLTGMRKTTIHVSAPTNINILAKEFNSCKPAAIKLLQSWSAGSSRLAKAAAESLENLLEQ